MIVLRGADLILPDRIVSGGTLVVEGERIAAILPSAPAAAADVTLPLDGHLVVPGFIDVHVHGLLGADMLDDGEPVALVAQRLTRYGVTAFCPTSVACEPVTLRRFLARVRACRTGRIAGAARVLAAHLESNFINPEYKGAQPGACLRTPRGAAPGGDFTGADILGEIARARADVGIVTVAPEIEGGLGLVAELASQGHHVSLGHSGASYEQALAAIDAGATQATHLFNRMPPVSHRAPGLAGAVLERREVVAELICDGVHVHPAVMHLAIGCKGTAGIMAITDASAGAGLEPGATAKLGGRAITVGDAAYLADGTLAGSVLTMDGAFRMLVTRVGLSLIDAATVCATTPARALGMPGFGLIAEGAVADLAVLDRDLNPVCTIVAGQVAWRRGSRPGPVS